MIVDCHGHYTTAPEALGVLTGDVDRHGLKSKVLPNFSSSRGNRASTRFWTIDSASPRGATALAR